MIDQFLKMKLHPFSLIPDLSLLLSLTLHYSCSKPLPMSSFSFLPSSCQEHTTGGGDCYLFSGMIKEATNTSCPSSFCDRLTLRSHTQTTFSFIYLNFQTWFPSNYSRKPYFPSCVVILEKKKQRRDVEAAAIFLVYPSSCQIQQSKHPLNFCFFLFDKLSRSTGCVLIPKKIKTKQHPTFTFPPPV